MDISDLKKILGSSFVNVEDLIKIKYNENINNIKKYNDGLDTCNEKLKETLISFGLENCVKLIDEINDLNEKKGDFIEIQNDIKRLNIQKKNMNGVLEDVINDINKSSIGIGLAEKQNKKESLIAQIKKIDEKINIKKKYLEEESEINKQIEENYNDFAQSMIVLDEEQKEEIHNIYVEAANYQMNISELESQNNQMIVEFPNLIDLNIEKAMDILQEEIKETVNENEAVIAQDIEEELPIEEEVIKNTDSNLNKPKEEINPVAEEIIEENVQPENIIPDNLEEKIINTTVQQMNGNDERIFTDESRIDRNHSWMNPDNAKNTGYLSSKNNETIDIGATVNYTDGLKEIVSIGKNIINSQKIKDIAKLGNEISKKIVKKISSLTIKPGLEDLEPEFFKEGNKVL